MKDDKDYLLNLTMSFYVGEPCRICGKLIEKKDLSELVYAGYSLDNKSRSAHGDCWAKNTPQTEWVYPENANS